MTVNNYAEEKFSAVEIYVSQQGDKFHPLSDSLQDMLSVDGPTKAEKLTTALSLIENPENPYHQYHCDRIRKIVEDNGLYGD